MVSYNVPQASVPEVAEMISKAARERGESPEHREEFINMVMSWIQAAHYPLMVHEWGHALQAISHPALYLRCLREYRAVWTVIGILRAERTPVSMPFTPSQPWGTELVWPTNPLRISVDGGFPQVGLAEEDWLLPRDLSEADLLEDAASVFQYKAEIGSQGSVEGYQRWLREPGHHHYSRTFNFLSKLLSPADAYVALPCLVMSAYLTNWPVNGFASLLAMTVRETPAPPARMGVDLYWKYLDDCLKAVMPVGACPDPRRALEEEGEHRIINQTGMLGLADEFSQHPLSPVVRLAWSDEANLQRIQEAILHPYRAFDRSERAAHGWVEAYQPPVTSFRVLGDMRLRDTLLLFSPTLLGAEGPDGEKGEEGWLSFLFDLINMKSFVFSAATPLLRSLPHNCDHQACPLHPYDMCRGWIHIPDRFEDCNFPDWLSRVALREVDHEAGVLRHAEHKEVG
jgi:hypothetical protein